MQKFDEKIQKPGEAAVCFLFAILANGVQRVQLANPRLFNTFAQI